MILTGRSFCLPSRTTVHELFSVARDASIIPDISLDPVLTMFLSLDSSAALQHQYNFLQRSMSREQQTMFNLNLTAELGGSRVSYGGVGVVALALSVLFDQVAQQAPGGHRREEYTNMHLMFFNADVKMIKKGSADAPFLSIWRIHAAAIMAAMQILSGHFTLLETFLSKMDYWNIPKESQISEIRNILCPPMEFVRAQGSTEVLPSAQRSWPKRIFGISASSRIGWIIHSYLSLVPGIANNQNRMAETTELYDNWLKLELLDHYERMTTRKRMSSVSMQQWLTGAAFHMHVRIHQARLHSVPLGSINSLRLSYKTGLGLLIRVYTAYLRTNIQETPAPGPQKAGTSAASRPTHTDSSILANMTCSGSIRFNVSRVGPSNESTTPGSTAGITRGCNTDGPGGDFRFNVLNGSSNTTMSKTLNVSSGYGREEEGNVLGLLVIEPSRNASHSVQHHPCESAAIQDALVTRIINTQDLERNRNFFLYPDKVFQGLLKQRDDFELSTN